MITDRLRYTICFRYLGGYSGYPAFGAIYATSKACLPLALLQSKTDISLSPEQEQKRPEKVNETLWFTTTRRASKIINAG